MRVSLSEAGTLTLWTQGQTNTTLTYHGTGETGNKDYAEISYLGVDENNGAIPLSLFESGVRWAGDANGILSIHISNASLDHHFIVRIATAGFYEFFLNFLVAGAADEDSDGFGDGTDNCPALSNPAQRNTDGDRNGDGCDADDDNDAVPDEEEAEGCALLADCDNDTIGDALDNCVLIGSTNLTDTDMDGMGNICDADDDNDNVADEDEAAGCQFLADCDSDTISDDLDNCPAEPNANQQDTDGDMIGDACDPTADNDADGVVDGEDNCPMQANALQEDFDGDLIGDVCDADDDNDDVPDEEEAAARCILDADCDDDGTNDGSDAFPLDATESADFDGDMIGDNADSDDDNDNVPDTEEAAAHCILDPDCDDDGTKDGEDNCPKQANAGQEDFDEDMIGDACDTDDDDDNVPDEEEATTRCILNSDCDNDGTEDGDDAFPLDATESADFDGDLIGDNADLDEDGDGLIEIWTADMLHNVRYVLNGSGYRESDTAPINQLGCGNQADDECIGYELTANISLAAYANYDGGKGWLPLGHDTEPAGFNCGTQSFNAVFEGNNRTVSNLRIARATEKCIGLFGHAASATHIRNLRLEAHSVSGRDSVGGMIGSGAGANISHSSVVVDSISGRGVGGLIGFSSGTVSISHSYSVADSINSDSHAGGLIGSGVGTISIAHSYSVADSINSFDSAGGLIGRGARRRTTSILYSYSVADFINGDSSAGGLIGSGAVGSTASISHSYSAARSLVGREDGAGGLVGNSGGTVSISDSYSVADSINSSDRNAGGLVGGSVDTVSISDSYSVAGSISGEDVGGLVLPGTSRTILSSYSDNTTAAGLFTPLRFLNIPRTTSALQSPTTNSGIYADWEEGGCNWDFGASSDYPALLCLPTSPELQRSFYMVEGGSVIIRFQEALLSITESAN